MTSSVKAHLVSPSGANQLSRHDTEYIGFPLTNRDVVIIINHDEVAQLQMPSCASGLAGNSLHCAAISEKSVGVIVHELESRLVEFCASFGLCNRKADSVRKTLSQRAGGDLNTWNFIGFGMTWCQTIYMLFRCRVIRFQFTLV